MSCENLVCAACGGLVAEARCATCRLSRERVHVHLSPQLLGPLLVAVGLLLAVVAAAGTR